MPIKYEEAVYPAQFRVKSGMFLPQIRLYDVNGDIHGFYWKDPVEERMPIILYGWVQGEVHLQWGFQSLS